MMDILGIGSIGAAVKGVTEMVREIRRPTLKSEDFASVLKARLEQQKPATPATQQSAQLQQATFQSSRFMKLRDANADGLLSVEESALEQELFNKLDTNQDGKLSSDEVRAGYMAGYTGAGPALPVQETT